MGFNQGEIDVLCRADAQTVCDAEQPFLNGSLQQFTGEFTCGGGGSQPMARM
jgi:hypothetical protein